LLGGWVAVDVVYHFGEHVEDREGRTTEERRGEAKLLIFSFLFLLAFMHALLFLFIFIAGVYVSVRVMMGSYPVQGYCNLVGGVVVAFFAGWGVLRFLAC
jgi:hypothetical protein